MLNFLGYGCLEVPEESSISRAGRSRRRWEQAEAVTTQEQKGFGGGSRSWAGRGKAAPARPYTGIPGAGLGVPPDLPFCLVLNLRKLYGFAFEAPEF